MHFAAASSDARMPLVERIFELRFLSNRSKNPFQRLIGKLARVFWMTFRTAPHPLVRGRLLQTIALTYFWQIWRRTVRRAVVVTLPEGSLLFCPAWSRMAGNYVTVGFDEYRESLFVLDFLKPGDLFVDVGANIGFYSIVAAKHGARSIAYEPIQRARDAIAESAKLNGLSQSVLISPKALSDTRGTSYFTSGNDNTNSLTGTADGAIAVDVSTLDDELDAAPALIKIDAEGFDLTVLRGGAGRVLPDDKPAIVVELEGGGLAIREWLLAHDYELFNYDPESKTLQPFVARIAPNGTPYHEYAVGVHRERVDDARARLAASPKRVLRAPSVRW
jgi:FkbM family methyltransferase